MTKYKGITVELHEKSSCGCGGCIFDSAESFIDTHGLDLDVDSLWEDESEREAIKVAFEMEDDEIEESL
jgi:hypothetical protein